MDEKSGPRDFAIEEMRVKDWPEVRAIYLEGIATGNATFETSAPEWTAWDSGHVKSCRFGQSGRRGLGMGGPDSGFGQVRLCRCGGSKRLCQ